MSIQPHYIQNANIMMTKRAATCTDYIGKYNRRTMIDPITMYECHRRHTGQQTLGTTHASSIFSRERETAATAMTNTCQAPSICLKRSACCYLNFRLSTVRLLQATYCCSKYIYIVIIITNLNKQRLNTIFDSNYLCECFTYMFNRQCN